MMTSNDLIVLEAINGLEGKIVSLQIETNQKIDALQTEIKDTRNELLTEIRLNQRDIEHLQTSVYWGFAIVGIVIGLASFIVATIALLPYLRKEKNVNKSEMSERDLRATIREEIRMAQNVAVGK